MKTIDKVAYVIRGARHFSDLEDFHKYIKVEIEEIESMGLEVEVQYQQSYSLASALILGRKEK